MSIFDVIFERLNGLEQRIANMGVEGKVTDVDPAKRVYRQTVGKDADGNDVKSPWIPYSQHAGALKAHIPPTVGQQMMIISNGDIESGVGIPSTWSDANPSPSDKGDENSLTFRGWRIDWNDGIKIAGSGLEVHLTAGKMKVTAGGTTFEFTEAMFKQTGGAQEHDGKNVGKNHVHDKVIPGGGLTGFPQA